MKALTAVLITGGLASIVTAGLVETYKSGYTGMTWQLGKFEFVIYPSASMYLAYYGKDWSILEIKPRVSQVLWRGVSRETLAIIRDKTLTGDAFFDKYLQSKALDEASTWKFLKEKP